MRLDKFLFLNKNIDSRSKAVALIKQGNVNVNNKVVLIPHFDVNENDRVEIIENIKYVSRGSEKLLHLIKTFNLDFKDSIVLDIGASTGGFTQVSLEYGAKLVYSLDVGTNQLHEKIKNDNRVIDLSQTHLDNIPNLEFNPEFNIVVTDVSFISLTRVFDALEKWKGRLKYFCALIKPQFECGYEAAKKNDGLIIGEKMHKFAINKIISYAQSHGWKLIYEIIESPIKGSKKGNIEFLGVFK